MKGICAFILCGLFCAVSWASEPFDVKVGIGKVTEVVFPEKPARVIKGGDPNSVLVEVLDKSVYLLPKTDAPASIIVSSVSGRSYPLNLIVSPEHDLHLDIGGDKREEVMSAGWGYSAMDVMKELLAGRAPAGAVRKQGKIRLPLSGSQIRLELEAAYDLGQLAAFVFVARNTASNSVIVPVERVSYPGLLAIASDRDMLGPQGSEEAESRLYFVAER